jgi:hypothetical protein
MYFRTARRQNTAGGKSECMALVMTASASASVNDNLIVMARLGLPMVMSVAPFEARTLCGMALVGELARRGMGDVLADFSDEIHSDADQRDGEANEAHVVVSETPCEAESASDHEESRFDAGFAADHLGNRFAKARPIEAGIQPLARNARCSRHSRAVLDRNLPGF